jgi:hypothetical protein
MTKEQVLGLIRHAFTFVGGILIMKGLIEEAAVTEISGAAIALVGAIWSVFEKKA